MFTCTLRVALVTSPFFRTCYWVDLGLERVVIGLTLNMSFARGFATSGRLGGLATVASVGMPGMNSSLELSNF